MKKYILEEWLYRLGESVKIILQSVIQGTQPQWIFYTRQKHFNWRNKEDLCSNTIRAGAGSLLAGAFTRKRKDIGLNHKEEFQPGSLTSSFLLFCRKPILIYITWKCPLMPLVLGWESHRSWSINSGGVYKLKSRRMWVLCTWKCSSSHALRGTASQVPGTHRKRPSRSASFLSQCPIANVQGRAKKPGQLSNYASPEYFPSTSTEQKSLSITVGSNAEIR